MLKLFHITSLECGLVHPIVWIKNKDSRVMPINEFLQTKKEIRFEAAWTGFALTSRDGFSLVVR